MHFDNLPDLTDRELETGVRKPADAARYQAEQEAEARRIRPGRGRAGAVRDPAVRLTTTFEWRRLLCALVAVYGPPLLIGLLAR
ncbi:hypothetical protein [Actinacidiphila glaucinigra]|uniref:hypothetical protein n=1 Tax=Actinacidiphila glaucinigra TaxID=235986 RepID=UPI003721FF18